jgi:hypothetical protein
MNIYFLVEGQSSEPDVYPVWLSYLVPELKRVDHFDEVEQNNYYLFSSYGIPYIEKDIINAVEDINALQKYHYLVICIDADAATVSQRKAKVFKLLEESKINLVGTSLKIIVQNRCIETWFLGNRKVYTRNPQKDTNFIKYSRYYNVSENDPERMDKPDAYQHSIARFHLAYLKAMFNERGRMTYSKSNSKEVQKESYFNELQNRVKDEPSHLSSFAEFLDFCLKIRSEMRSNSFSRE